MSITMLVWLAAICTMLMSFTAWVTKEALVDHRAWRDNSSIIIVSLIIMVVAIVVLVLSLQSIIYKL